MAPYYVSLPNLQYKEKENCKSKFNGPFGKVAQAAKCFSRLHNMRTCSLDSDRNHGRKEASFLFGPSVVCCGRIQSFYFKDLSRKATAEMHMLTQRPGATAVWQQADRRVFFAVGKTCRYGRHGLSFKGLKYFEVKIEGST